MSDDAASKEGTTFLQIGFDLPTERSGLLAVASEYIEAGRTPSPIVCFYRDADRIVSVTSRAADTPADQERAVKEILNLYPTLLLCDTVMISWHAPSIKLNNGTMGPAMLLILVKRSGAETMAYPYYISEEDGSVVFDAELLPATDAGRMYSSSLSHAFAVYAFSWNGIGTTKSVCKWLYSKGHEVQFDSGYSVDNVDAKIALRVPIEEPAPE